MRAPTPLLGLWRRWAVPRRLAAYGICLGAGPFLLGSFIVPTVRSGDAMLDFRFAFYPAGRAVLDGNSPYVPLAHLHAQLLPFVYPPVAAWLFAPLSPLPYAAAASAYFVVTLLALWAALAVMGVRDPRVYTVVCAWPAVLNDLQTGAVGGLMTLLLAVAWRYRDRPAGPTVLALAGALKLFLWPLGIWLLLTRRLRAAAIAAVSGAAFLLLPWAAIGFAGLGSYPAMLQRLTAQEGASSYALGSLVAALALPHALTYALAGLLALPGLRCLRDPDPARRDRGALCAAVMLALALTPILWLHYLVILVVPIALAARRLGWIWWLPAIMLVAPFSHPDGALLPLAVFWIGVAAVAVAAPWSPAGGRGREPAAGLASQTA